MLKVLFLIRYVEEFDGTTRNLVTLCLDVLNANRQSMIQKVNGSLDRLKHRKLVSQTGDAWYFLTSEEKRIRAEISGTEISQYDLTKELWKLAFEEALGDLKKHRYESNNVDYSLVRNLNGREAKRSKVSGLVVWLISPQHAEYEHFLNPGIAILESQKHEGQVILRLKEDAGIEQDLMLYLRSEKYLKSRRRDGVAPETQRIFDQLRWKNSNHRRPSLIGKLGESIGEADCFVNGRQLETRGKNAKKTIASAVNDLIQSTYSKMDMLTHYDPDPLARARDYLRGKVVEQPDIENTAVNSRALTELCDHMRMSRKTSVQVVLSGLINRYYARPYGWPEEQTLLLLVRLATLSENNSQLQFIEHSTTLRNDQILDVLNNKGRWKNILVRLQEIDAELVNRAKETGQRLFERLGPDAPTELHTFLSKEIKLWQVELEKYHLQNSTGRYPGIEDVQRSLTSINKLLSNGDMVSFLEEFVAQSDSLVSVGDIVANQRHFFASQKPIWDRLCEALLEFGPSASQLEEDKLVRSHLQRLHDIRNAPEPYNKIKDIKGCIQVVKEANDRLLVDARNESISALTEIWDDLLAKLDDYNADPEDRSRFNNKIGKLERKIHEQTDILQIRDVQNQAQQLRSKTMDKISPVNIVPVFPRELGSQYLETEADVDAFLENLGKRLRSVISNGEHVEIR